MIPSNDRVAQRAKNLARLKLIFDLLLGIALFLNDAPLPLLVAVGVDILFLWPYLRFVRSSPALTTIVTLTFSSLLVSLAPFGLGAPGVALWALAPLVPLGAAYVLGRRRQVWQTAAIISVTLAAAAILLLRSGQPIALELAGIAALWVSLVFSVWGVSWLADHAFGAETRHQTFLGEPITVVRTVIIVPFQWVVGGVRAEALRLELHDIRQRLSPRWIILDLATAGELGRHDLSAIEHAAAASSSAHCAVVLARAPVDALGHLDFAQPIVGRVERFATVPQAVEAGLRRLGWVQNPEQAQRLITTYS